MRSILSLTTATLLATAFALPAQAEPTAPTQAAAEREAQALQYEGVDHLVPRRTVAPAARRTGPAAATTAERSAQPARAPQPAAPTASAPALTRAQVIAELLQARARGEMDFAAQELGQVSAPWGGLTAETRLARAR